MMYKKGLYLGGGGFGKVYIASDSAGNSYALKELKLDNYTHDPFMTANITKRFKQEAIKQAEISHPNVIRVVHHDLEATPPYFVMELGQNTFADIINGYHEGIIDYDLVKKGLFDILSGLGVIHELGIWHRDLKPQNVLFLPPERFAISDFGLIAVHDSQVTTLTMTGTTAGTREYAPPEFMKDFKKANATSDIYSFGSILHDIFVRTARVPYSELKDGHGKMGEVIAKCTQAKQYHRYQNIEELRAELYEALSEFEHGGVLQDPTVDLSIFDEPTLTEGQCESIIDMIDAADAPQLQEIYRAFSNDFIERIYLSSNAAANHIAEQFAKYVLENSFEFGYCDVLADRLVLFIERGNVGVKAINLLALLELGASHNRWYVERKFAKFAGLDCPPSVIKRMIVDAKIHDIDFKHRLNHLLWSISVRKEDFHPQILEHLEK